VEHAAGTRRSFVKALAAFALGGPALWRFLTPRGSGARPAAVVSVPASEVPAEGAWVAPQHGCAVVRHGDRVTAVGLACTHLGCTVTATSDGFACPCHGSQFDSRGGVCKGPATRALQALNVEQIGATIHVTRG